MLKAIWNKTVYGAEYLRQMRDGNVVQFCDNEIANAREGYRLQVIGNTYGAIAVKVDLTPQQAQEIIQEMTIRKAETARAMEKRRTEYGFKF
jgi:hypothetical protein